MKCYAIGYQGRSLPEMCRTLSEAGVEVLIDVRERAWSNRPEFRKTAIATGLATVGIEYVHAKEAGNPFRPRAGGEINALECMRKYRGYLRSTPGIVERMKILIGRKRVVFLCYEARSEDCHRGILLDALKRTAPRLSIVHL